MLGGGVLYRMLLTASPASITGRSRWGNGGNLWCRCDNLCSNADVLVRRSLPLAVEYNRIERTCDNLTVRHKPGILMPIIVVKALSQISLDSQMRG